MYLGSEYSVVRAIAADPDGRFVLMIADNSLVRILTTGANEKVELLGLSSIPMLDKADKIVALQSSTAGRIYVITSSLTPNRAVLVDSENDGVFENIHLFDNLPGEKAMFPYGDIVDAFTGS